MIGRDFSQVFDGHVFCLQKVGISPVAEKNDNTHGLATDK